MIVSIQEYKVVEMSTIFVWVCMKGFGVIAQL